MNGVTTNAEQGLFVIPSGKGYTCFGFDNLLKELKQLARWLGIAPPQDSERGTLAQYQQHRNAIEAVAKRGGIPETWFHDNTPAAVRQVLEAARLSKRKVRIYCGDIDGRSWLGEFEVVGYIGRSTGLMKIPLLIAPRAHGGPALLDSHIVRIQDAATKKDLYSHPAFHVPRMAVTVTRKDDAAYAKYPWSVKVAKRDLDYNRQLDWETYARFKTEAKAQKWVDFMHGNVMKP